MQLFDSAKAPAALVIFSKNHTQDADYRFDYWAPKSDINLKTNRLITLSQSDRNVIASHMVQDNPMVFKNCFWMNGPQGKLLNYIKLFPGISDLIGVYSNMRNASSQNDNQWLIGQGFRPAKKNQMDNDTYRYQQYEVIARIPHLPVRKFRTLAQNFDDLPPWENSNIDSTGFQKGYDGPRILIPRSITATQYRLRASYAQNPGSFQESIVVISVPKGEERRAKLLTALLNSKLFLWFAFHDTASFGIERPKVLQSELLRLPFPSPKDLPECKRSESAGNKLVQIVEREIQNANDTFSILSSAENPELFKKIDRLAYDYFCLSDEEIILVEDTVKYIIPAVHPPKKSYPIIWETSNDDDRKAYADVLIRSLKEWFDESCSINIMLEAHSKDLAILRLSLEEDCREESYYEKIDHQISDVLGELSKHINHPLPGNFQLKPDFRLFHDNNLYLVKPIQKRFWLRSTAIADADSIALDLQKFSGSSTNWSNT
ncbi:MAG: hypothetical protein OXC62_01270 [Aestuariivita sp.]|nr:hypothetical protein [Aestuariivita sp.]